MICGTATSGSLRRETSSERRFDLSLPSPPPPLEPTITASQAQGCVLGEKGSRSHESIVTGLLGPDL